VTPAWSSASKVNAGGISDGIASSDIPIQRRSDANIGSRKNAGVGCWIQASMVMPASCPTLKVLGQDLHHRRDADVLAEVGRKE